MSVHIWFHQYLMIGIYNLNLGHVTNTEQVNTRKCLSNSTYVHKYMHIHTYA